MKKIRSLVFAVSLVALGGCSDGGSQPVTNTNPQGTGGTTTTGGAAGGTTTVPVTGGKTTETGGNSGPGGQTGAAGAGGSSAAGGTTSASTIPPGGTTTAGGTKTNGGTTTAGGSTAAGGSTSTGGSTSAGGSTGPTTSLGGTTSSGGTKTNGGTTSNSGTTSNGGTTSTGGANGGATSSGGASGGATSTGGASGGATSTGGASGGAASTGGSTSTGGTTSSGGTKTSGGTTSNGGTTSTGGATSTGPCSVLPVTPNASPQTKNLLCYIYQLYGKNVLSGQQETSWAGNPLDDITWFTSNGMKEPAILGGDFMYAAGGGASSETNTTKRAIDYWNGGGITMIRYHMGMPKAGETSAQDCYQDAAGSTTNHCAEATPPAGGTFFTSVMTSGTPENTSFMSRLNYIAYQIGLMKAANVPVVLAIFHEAQPNGWFWWSKGSGANYVALWKYTFDYLTGTKGLNNIIWLMPFSGLNGIAATSFSAYFPGKDMVDLSGPDYSLDAATYTKVKTVVGNTMPIPLHECGNMPDPATMFPSSAPWVLFNTWAGYQKSSNTLAHVQSVYGNALTITRDKVPNLK